MHDYFGYGHLESIHEKAMAIKLRKEGFDVKMQAPFQVYFGGELIILTYSANNTSPLYCSSTPSIKVNWAK